MNGNIRWEDQIEDLDELGNTHNLPRQVFKKKTASGKKKAKPNPSHAPINLAGDRVKMDFTYQASRHEHEWLIGSLQDFYEQNWFSDILRKIKGGKEASVYQCAGNETTNTAWLAAKVYRPRKFRNLRNDAQYREGRNNLDGDGRVILDERAQRAMQKRTSIGLEMLHTSWLMHEYQTLKKLHQAGADVPAVYAAGSNAILMAYIGWAEMPAPILHSVNLAPRAYPPLFERVLHNVEIMLAQGYIHGDLSAFNILYMDGDIWLIDFPQVIQPEQNRNARMIFERDITRLCEYFQQHGMRLNPQQLAQSLWHKYALPTKAHYDLNLLDPEDERDRQFFAKNR